MEGKRDPGFLLAAIECNDKACTRYARSRVGSNGFKSPANSNVKQCGENFEVWRMAASAKVVCPTAEAIFRQQHRAFLPAPSNKVTAATKITLHRKITDKLQDFDASTAAAAAHLTCLLSQTAAALQPALHSHNSALCSP